MADMREPIETGCPDPFQYMHPVMRKNFGMWKYHEHPRPGVLGVSFAIRFQTRRLHHVFATSIRGLRYRTHSFA